MESRKTSVFEHTNYRSFLKSVLADRKSLNPAYSLRAMARDLGIRPSHLSDIHNGKKSLSAQNALTVAMRLGLNERGTDYFCTLVQFDGARSPQAKAALVQKLGSLNEERPVTDLSVDLFKVISDWYHIPILEMTNLEKFTFNAANVANRLGISPIEADAAIERLLRLELLELKNGAFHKTRPTYAFKSPARNTALKHFHRQMLAKASDALDTQSPEDRYVGSDTFVFDPDQLGEVKKLVEDFRKKLLNLVEKGRHPTETYHLGVQVFSLMKKERKE